jgi:N-acetylglutamate synthase-like GNAT family acetyltransferase
MSPLLLQALLEPLQRTGVLVRRTSAELRAQLPNFTVIERETKVRHELSQRSRTAAAALILVREGSLLWARGMHI